MWSIKAACGRVCKVSFGEIITRPIAEKSEKSIGTFVNFVAARLYLRCHVFFL